MKPFRRKKEVEPSPPKFKNLREVVDFTRDFSMFFSGVEYEVYLNGCYDMGVRNFLMSYEYVKARSLKKITENFKDKIHLFIDSGANTYMNDPRKVEHYTLNMWEEHIQKYLQWAEKNKEYIFAIANLDLEKVVGADKVKEWNQKYFEPFMLRTGIPVCFVWHEKCYYATWEQYCQRYPYVGISAVNDSNNDLDIETSLKQYLKIAEKYGAVVHGMGMTRTSLLPRLPFFTVDSTSWKVGMRYGIFLTWERNKVCQHKKDEWDNKVLPVITNYPNVKFDLEKLKEYYEPEVVKLGAYAFIQAENYIKNCLSTLEYWKKAQVVKQNINFLPADFFPSIEWLDNESLQTPETVEEYAKKMNISTAQDTVLSIYYMTVFLNWDNPEFAEIKVRFTDNDIINLHDFYINKVVDSQEQRIEDLIKFFRENLEGTSTFLLNFGTNFDKRQIERDEYLDDEEDDIEYLDTDKSEVQKALRTILPSPADLTEEDDTPNFDKLDDETYKKMGLIPVRNERGEIIEYKQRRVYKSFYSKKFPKFACDNCLVGTKCPEFKPNHVCAYNKIFGKFDTRNMTDLINIVQSITQHDTHRLQRAMIAEILNGGIDANVSNLEESTLRHVMLLKDLYSHANQEVIRQTRVVRSDGSMENTVTVSNPQSGGVLEKLFGNMSEDKPATQNSAVENEKIVADSDTITIDSVIKDEVK